MPPEGETSRADRTSHAEESMWRTLGTLWRGGRLIVIVTGLAAIASVVIALLIPNWYRATSRLLLPESSGSGLAGALLGDLGGAAQSILGTGAGDYKRYLAIMDSRYVHTAVVDSFDLVHVYGVADGDAPLDDAIDLLADNTEFIVDGEYGFLEIQVVDEDPARAADMANYFVALLDRINNDLASGTAARFRGYVEERYEEARLTRLALLDSIRVFQEDYGVFDLQAQTAAFFDQVAELRVSALRSEIQYEAARNRLGPDNPDLAAMSEVVNATNRKYDEALTGRERVLPVDLERMPRVVQRYLDFEMERTIQERILTYVAPMLEQARFEEQRSVEALQAVDRATPPAKKDGPRRSVICVATTLSAFILVAVYVLLADWWERRHSYFIQRFRDSHNA